MKQSLLRFCFVTCLLLIGFSNLHAQTSISGKVSDDKGETLPGANVSIKGTVMGTITDVDGKFKLVVSTPPPFTVVVGFLGFTSQEFEVTAGKDDFDIKLVEEAVMGQEVVVSASRVEESIMKSPVTIEKMDIIAVQQTASADFYDGISKMKGVQSTSSSLTFNSLNTRGFATAANTRFVQLIDGMDNASPVLNFPTGNLVGISELDVESVELVPGAASALYGPNAFNGILFMNSKSPFDYQGFSASAKAGVTVSNSAPAGGQAHGTQPYNAYAIRYAKAITSRLAFKVNFSALIAQDWRANNYSTFRGDVSNYDNPNNPRQGATNFDGMNTYGDEAVLSSFSAGTSNLVATGIVNSPGFASTLGGLFGGNQALAQTLLSNYLQTAGAFPRTGFREEDLLDNNNARSIKADAAIHYKLTDKLELIYNYRYGTGSSIYQGGNRYALRDFSIQFHKLELKGTNFFVRAYASLSDAGKSYNIDALGLLANSRLLSSNFVPAYAGNLVGGGFGAYASSASPIAGQPMSQTTINNAFAATMAANPFGVGTAPFNNLMNELRFRRFKDGGASFIDNSRFYHAEFNYNFKDLIDPKTVEIQVGGNARRYDLFTDGTIYNENRDGTGNKRITIDEYGAYVQAGKSLLDDKLKLTASIRYDKNQNFQGQVNPRASAVYSFGDKKQHNVRASYQTGFRNPATQDQFIYFPTTSGILLGSTRANAEAYGLFEGGNGSDGQPVRARDLAGNAIRLEYLKPERLQAIEVGYKGVFNNKLMLDVNGFYNIYDNFISAQTVRAENGGNVTGTGAFAAGTLFRPYINATVPVESWGVGVGYTYKLPKKFELNGSYTYSDFQADLSKNPTFEVGFNTPRHRFVFGLSNREVVKNLGFDISYRWQDRFLWQSAFANGYVDAFGVIDAQVSYKLKDYKSIVKLGANNLFGKDYLTLAGGPWVGQLYYISVTFDEFFR
ncbi:MAG: TonB-dependent receptor [Cytophagales bacterium]|nr:MAG: TonB-dependent receptor [Cytophagales bacterium]